MMPYISILDGKISSYALMAAVGVLVFILTVHIELGKRKYTIEEENFIFPKIVMAGMAGWGFSVILDALFKFRENGGFVVSGSTFYGGLIGAVVSLYILLKTTTDITQYTIAEWYDILTIPQILFHMCGRVGCFLGGCCYGKETDSVLAVRFPDNAEYGIFHNGEKCYPTQLIEAVSLLVICVIIWHTKRRFECYLLLYALTRFLIEYLRGDDRGYVLPFITPAQMVSILIILCIVVRKIGVWIKLQCNLTRNHKGIEY